MQQCCGTHLDLDPPGQAAPTLSQGRTEGLCHLLWKERAPAIHAQEPHAAWWCWCASVPRGWAQAVGKTEGWVASSLPTSPLSSWGGIRGTHLSGGDKFNLYLLLKLSPGGGVLFAPLWWSCRCLLRPQHWSAAELAVCLALTAREWKVFVASRAIPIWSTKYEICK